MDNYTEDFLSSLAKALKDFPLRSQAEKHNPKCPVILRLQGFSWIWYIYEYDPVSHIAFAYVEGEFNECGSVDINELLEVAKLKHLQPMIQYTKPNSKLSEISSFATEYPND